MQQKDDPHDRFYLGGHDLEMLTIRNLLESNGQTLVDRDLGWGAKASAYRVEIEAGGAGTRCVFIELCPDVEVENAIWIDHHGQRAGADQPSSLEQVFQLLQVPREAWTREFALVSANDKGYLPSMQELGATPEEMTAIRQRDRQAQGITDQQEQQAAEAIKTARRLAGGRLTVVDLPHEHTATVSDRLAKPLGGPGFENLLVNTPDGASFFGAGHFVRWLANTFPDGYFGGALPERGFWGTTVSIADLETRLTRQIERSQ